MKSIDNTEFRTRVSSRLASLGLSMRAASLRANMAPDTLGKFLTGKTRSLRADNMAALARVLDVNESWLMGSSPDASVDHMPFGVRFGGVVEAGALRPREIAASEQRVPIPHDWRYPPGAQAAYRVMDDSMDRAGITEGMHLLALDVHAWERANGEPRDGAIVIAEHCKENEALRELTAARLHITRAGITLQPDSSNPRHQAKAMAAPALPDEPRSAIVAVCLMAVLVLV